MSATQSSQVDVFSPYWKDRRVLVTGGAGFLGRAICQRLRLRGAHVIVPRKKNYDFVHLNDALSCLRSFQPDIVIHSAAYYGGLGITIQEAGRIYYENLVMGANVMEAARRQGVEKFVTVGTACSYPGNIERPLRESDLWSGPLHGSVLGYGSVKKMMAIQGQVYEKQYGLKSIHLIPSNLYGPYDCYDDYRSHVVAALIKKFCDAHVLGQNVTCWGSGRAIREFLYVDDCADGVIRAAESYNETEPLNIGTGNGTTIMALAETIARTLRFQGNVHWDTSQPDGQKTKILDVTRMKSVLNWYPKVTLNEGVKRSILWYLTNECPQTKGKDFSEENLASRGALLAAA